MLAAVAGAIATADADRARRIDGQLGDERAPPGDWSVRIAGADHAVVLEEDAITVDGQPVAIAMEYTPGDRFVSVELYEPTPTMTTIPSRCTASSSRAPARLPHDHARREARGSRAARARRPARRAHDREDPARSRRFLICPMPGLLVTLHVGEGDAVQPGQPLATVEAMKMENILRAEKSGTVKQVNAKQGDSLAVDEVILELE